MLIPTTVEAIQAFFKTVSCKKTKWRGTFVVVPFVFLCRNEGINFQIRLDCHWTQCVCTQNGPLYSRVSINRKNSLWRRRFDGPIKPILWSLDS